MLNVQKNGLKMHDVQISGEHPRHNNWDFSYNHLHIM